MAPQASKSSLGFEEAQDYLKEQHPEEGKLVETADAVSDGSAGRDTFVTTVRDATTDIKDLELEGKGPVKTRLENIRESAQREIDNAAFEEKLKNIKKLQEGGKEGGEGEGGGRGEGHQ